jgi:hypothetical protein
LGAGIDDTGAPAEQSEEQPDTANRINQNNESW